MPRPDWSRPLPRPLTIPDVLTLETLADVRMLVEKRLPAEYRAKFTWRQFAGLLKRAAHGEQDVAEVSTALRIVLQLEGIQMEAGRLEPMKPAPVSRRSARRLGGAVASDAPARHFPRPSQDEANERVSSRGTK